MLVDACLHAYDSVSEARASLGRYLDFSNRRRPHSSLDGMTLDQAYYPPPPLRLAAQLAEAALSKRGSDNPGQLRSLIRNHKRTDGQAMHIGRRYQFTDFLGWTRWEAVYLVSWSLFVTLFLQVSNWSFLTIPAPILTIVGSALAIVLAFKNQQCYARFNDALAVSAQLTSSSLVLANKLTSTVGSLDVAQSGPRLKEMFYRHFAWLTALRFYLRERKAWENTFEAGNAKFLAKLPTPESQSDLKDELKTYLSDADLQKVIAHQGDKDAFILHWQYEALRDLHDKQPHQRIHIDCVNRRA